LMVDRNVLGIGLEMERVSIPDENSIMLYPIDGALTLDGVSIIPSAIQPSALDIQAVQRIYPYCDSE